MRDKLYPASINNRDMKPRLTNFISRDNTTLPKPQIKLMGVKGRLKASNRKNPLVYLGASALIVITIYFILTSFFLPPTIPDFELQVIDWHYEPSIGSFRVSGTIGIPTPPDYKYRLKFLSITDGTKIIILDPSYQGHGGTISITFHTTLFRPAHTAGPDWTFLLTQRIILESKVVQLTFEYEIEHNNFNVLKEGTEVFSVNVE